MPTRSQISLDPDLQRRAHAKAAALGISFAEYVRRLLANDLGAPKATADISAVFDLGASDRPTDVARDKHKMLDEALWREHLRKISRKSAAHGRARTKRR